MKDGDERLQITNTKSSLLNTGGCVFVCVNPVWMCNDYQALFQEDFLHKRRICSVVSGIKAEPRRVGGHAGFEVRNCSLFESCAVREQGIKSPSSKTGNRESNFIFYFFCWVFLAL